MHRLLRFALPAGLVLAVASLLMYTHVSAVSPASAGFVSAATDLVSNTSNQFAQLPGLGGTVNVSANSCVVATFSSELFQPAFSDGFQFRVLVDDTVMEPGQVGEVIEAGRIQTVAFTFWTCGVTKGTHVVTIEWKSVGTQQINARARTLIAEVK